MDLFILRHGEAGKKLTASKNKDSERPLTVSGQKEVADISNSLKDLGIKFDFIISSPLKRAHQTAAIVAKTFKKEKQMENWNELKPEGSRQELYRKLASPTQFKRYSSVLIVGHEPYLTDMISDIISDGKDGKGEGGSFVLKKAGLARIGITSSTPPNLHGELKWLLTPKHMRKMGK
ncbi:MAG TPA: phosphohistidine phosphatase SixA [Nitrososphaeraceae archaeon]|jgi:phosphohistidine phosphatase|nr:phosphohistidine phosphatase SixA [Nitrososphaeraceae archaeon]